MINTHESRYNAVCIKLNVHSYVATSENSTPGSYTRAKNDNAVVHVFWIKTSNKYRLFVSIDGFIFIADVIKCSVDKFGFHKFKSQISIRITFWTSVVFTFGFVWDLRLRIFEIWKIFSFWYFDKVWCTRIRHLLIKVFDINTVHASYSLCIFNLITEIILVIKIKTGI